MIPEREKRLTIDLYDDGDIKVHDVVNNVELDATTNEAEVLKMMRENTITGIVCATILFSNSSPSCRWIKIGNKWYWMCWK